MSFSFSNEITSGYRHSPASVGKPTNTQSTSGSYNDSILARTMKATFTQV